MSTPRAPITVKLQWRTKAEKNSASAPSTPTTVNPGTVFGTASRRPPCPSGRVRPSGPRLRSSRRRVTSSQSPVAIQASPSGRTKRDGLAWAEVVDLLAEDELGEVDGQQPGRGRDRDEEQRVRAEREQQRRCDDADDGDRRQAGVDAAAVARTLGPEAGELLDA